MLWEVTTVKAEQRRIYIKVIVLVAPKITNPIDHDIDECGAVTH